MAEHTIYQYSLFNSNDGQVKIIEFDSEQGTAHIWGLSKQYSYCNECHQHKDFFKCNLMNNCPEIKKYKNDIQDPEYVENGDFENTYGYYSCMNDFIDSNIKNTYPKAKIVPLGIFQNIHACRSYLNYIRIALNKELI